MLDRRSVDPGRGGHHFLGSEHDGVHAGAPGRQISRHRHDHRRYGSHWIGDKHRHRRLWRPDALALLIPMLLGYLIPVLLLGTPSIAGLAKPSQLSRNEGVALIKIGLAGIVTAPMYWLLSSSDRWFLQHYHGAEAVGVYSIGYSVAIVGMMVNNGGHRWSGRPRPRGSTSKTRRGRRNARPAHVASRGRDGGHLAGSRRPAATSSAGWPMNGFTPPPTTCPTSPAESSFTGLLHLASTGLLLAKQIELDRLVVVGGRRGLRPAQSGAGAKIRRCWCCRLLNASSFAFISLGILATSPGQISAPSGLEPPRGDDGRRSCPPGFSSPHRGMERPSTVC